MAIQLHNKVNREILIKKMKESSVQRTTISFYNYVKIANPELFRDHLYLIFDKLNVLGRIYIAHEGINAQISVPNEFLDQFKSEISEITFLKDIRLNYAIDDDGKSFFKLKIKVRPKIVADGLDDTRFDVTDSGIHLDAEEFNKLTDKEDVIVVDMRNHYESEVGKFENAITPDVVTFKESLPIVADLLAEKKDHPVIMYCTGGIRCEKASAYMKYRGFKDVYQLNGGIIEYARQVKEKGLKNKFIGKNFVFDERLGERISEQVISKCHQCGAICDSHTNCLNDQCHILFIQCPTCSEKYHQCCSQRCADFLLLPEELKNELAGKLEFNGSAFSKGRYKALGKDEHLDLT
ncbi:MAG: rhodanese-related sulfurtransferase [Saprospiraceae bacterium]